MRKSLDNTFGVFGNPINHSKSPMIHNLFSKQTGIIHCYTSFFVPMNNFSETIKNFFISSGKGANITSPFKERAVLIADVLTTRSKISGAVNTFKKLSNGKLLGDNTDGIGLLTDLKRLKFIKEKSRILLIGAGGVARGIIFPLLSFGCSIFILNRTVSRAKLLVDNFIKYGSIQLIKLLELKKNFHFDLIINATSNRSLNDIPILPTSIINSETPCYDICYSSSITPFLNWYIKNGGKVIADGIGMLVNQAAHSFFLWHGVYPKTDAVINILQTETIKKIN